MLEVGDEMEASPKNVLSFGTPDAYTLFEGYTWG